MGFKIFGHYRRQSARHRSRLMVWEQGGGGRSRMPRAPCCDKASVRRGQWAPEEDAILKAFVEKNGTAGSWISLPHKAGLSRCGKSCRLRWLNYLRPNIKLGEFTDEEDAIIVSLHRCIGSKWSAIVPFLQPGRTDNDVKNHWNSKLKKKHQQPPFGSWVAEAACSTRRKPPSPAILTAAMDPPVLQQYLWGAFPPVADTATSQPWPAAASDYCFSASSSSSMAGVAMENGSFDVYGATDTGAGGAFSRFFELPFGGCDNEWLLASCFELNP